MTASKLEPRRHADGRVGYPEVAVYVVWKDGAAVDRVDVPPTIESHPDMATVIPPPLSSTEAARWNAEHWDRKPRSSLSYTMKILDYAAFRELELQGFWLSAEHNGTGAFVKNDSPAPLA